MPTAPRLAQVVRGARADGSDLAPRRTAALGSVTRTSRSVGSRVRAPLGRDPPPPILLKGPSPSRPPSPPPLPQGVEGREPEGAERHPPRPTGRSAEKRARPTAAARRAPPRGRRRVGGLGRRGRRPPRVFGVAGQIPGEGTPAEPRERIGTTKKRKR